MTDPTTPAIDPEQLIAALAAISTDAATALSVHTQDADELRNALVRAWKAADAAIRPARGM